MKFTTSRKEDFKNADRLVIRINEVEYRLSETIEGKLEITKVDIGEGSDSLNINPYSGNQIQLY